MNIDKFGYWQTFTEYWWSIMELFIVALFKMVTFCHIKVTMALHKSKLPIEFLEFCVSPASCWEVGCASRHF